MRQKYLGEYILRVLKEIKTMIEEDVPYYKGNMDVIDYTLRGDCFLIEFEDEDRQFYIYFKYDTPCNLVGAIMKRLGIAYPPLMFSWPYYCTSDEKIDWDMESDERCLDDLKEQFRMEGLSKTPGPQSPNEDKGIRN